MVLGILNPFEPEYGLLNDAGEPLIFLTGDDPPPECCCEFCDFCPCCIRCPDVSSSVDLWVENQVQDADFLGVCDCPDFTTVPLTLALDDCDVSGVFLADCDNAVRFQILEDGVCKMRVTLSGNSVHSGSPPGGLWEAVWEKTLGGAVECSDLHELAFVSQTGGDDVPCDFSGSTFFADILIP